ncbi:MAG TPA: transposase [Burkholderiales bacterium]|nr:transposase [Burkholderiales bacterium]
MALHIMQRGNDRQDCFRQDTDRLVYMSLLRDYASLRHCAVHAYCLMTNHVHLLVTPEDTKGCALMMRDLGRCYAAYFNRRYAKVGALWQHPFRSCLVDSAEYVIACYRYIERNPVRAGMVRRPAEHPWSSYAGNTRLRSDELLTPHVEYLALGLDETSRGRLYRELVSEADQPAVLETLRSATEAGFPLVSERLKAELKEAGVRFERGVPGPRTSAGAAEGVAGQFVLLTE